MADIYFIDGSALDASSFGAFDDNGVWQAAAYSGTFGTNGFHLLDFANESTVGNDSSGNNNDFTAVNLTGSIPSIASPNLPTWNGSIGSYWTRSNSNYDADYSGSSTYTAITAALSASTTYHFYLNFTDGSSSYGGWFFSSTSTAPSNTVPDELGGNSLGLRTGESSLGTYGTYATANSTSNGQDKINVSALSSASNGEYSIEFVINTTVGKVWAKKPGDSGYVGGGDPTNSSSTASFLIPTGAQYFGYMGYSINTFANFKTIGGNPADLDVLRDVPTNGTQTDTGAGGEVSGNYCTMNSLDANSSITLTNGNLDASVSSVLWVCLRGTIGVSSGKWFWETTINEALSSTNTFMAGIATAEQPLNNYMSTSAGAGYYAFDGNKYPSNGSYGATYGINDVIGTALDLDAGTLTFYKNGVSQGQSHTGLTGTWFPCSAFYGTLSVTMNFGARSFAHSAPSGYKALCTANLPTPTIVDGSDYFETKTFTANNGSQSITLGFSPDLVWTKSRANSYEHQIFDTVRGDNQELVSSSNAAERNLANSLTFNSSGFTMPSTNNNANYGSGGSVAWAWDAGANSSKTFTVKVVSDSGNKYRFDNFGTSAVTLDLEEGSTYVFDQSDSSNSGHPLRFSTTSDGTHGSGTEYTTGVTATGTPGSAGAKTTIVVAASAPTLYYYCSAHSGMGGQANTNSTAGASNFDGSIQSTVRANQTAGFSIVSYSGSGSAATVGHGLNAAPDMIILKDLNSAQNWKVLHTAAITSSYSNHYQNLTWLNSNSPTTSTGTGNGYPWNNTAPTSSVFSVSNSGTNYSGSQSSVNYIAYCFSGVENYSQFGSYVGDGVAYSGPFVFTGFRPAFLMIKGVDGGDHWYMYDSKRNGYNPANEQLTADITNAEYAAASYPSIDFLSNGFKVKSGNSAGRNQSGITYMYMCFADKPFQANGGLAR
jgi:hypothetical protein